MKEWFFFSSRRRHTRFDCDWSSDVCSSDLTFIPDNLANISPYGEKLQRRGIEIIYHPYFKKVRDYLIAHGLEFDAVVLSRCDFARKHIADTRRYAPRSRIIFDTVDLHFVRTDRAAQMTS